MNLQIYSNARWRLYAILFLLQEMVVMKLVFHVVQGETRVSLKGLCRR